MRSDHSLGKINHCLEWYEIVLRTHLPNPDRGLGLTYTYT